MHWFDRSCKRRLTNVQDQLSLFQKEYKRIDSRLLIKTRSDRVGPPSPPGNHQSLERKKELAETLKPGSISDPCEFDDQAALEGQILDFVAPVRSGVDGNPPGARSPISS